MKYSFRLRARTRVFGLINAIGLAIGTLCCLYILLYAADQYRYDRQYRMIKTCIGSRPLVAFLIATPLGWWATHRWLEGVAYRTALNWWIFLLDGLVMTFSAFVTLGIQTLRAARANPVESLGTE